MIPLTHISRSVRSGWAFLAGVSMFALPAVTFAQTQQASPPQKFYGRSLAESSPPTWPALPKAPKGAPNVILVITDDVGFGAYSTFGGLVPTPVLDALATKGLKYNQFHTSALCATTRASLLTGRNPHRVGMGHIPEQATGYDGYNSIIPKSAATVGQILAEGGYSTAAFGKWHLTPTWEQTKIGPFDHWPSGLGFQYFYGFLPGSADQFAPNLIENNNPVQLPRGPDYIFEKDMADHAINWIRQQHAIAPDKPFFVYYAPGTAHAPHHAPKEWIEKFRGKFDQGWDAARDETFARQKTLGVVSKDAVLTPRPDNLPAWSSLTADQKRLYARYMEAFAGALAYTDHQFGRVLEGLRDIGEIDNTLIIFIEGDNGGSVEGSPTGLFYQHSLLTGKPEDQKWVMDHIDEIGGPNSYPLYPSGWGWATNAPFQYWKQIASHLGGTRNGMVISWPKQINQTGGVRSQYSHVSDIMPTILEAAGIEAPAKFKGVEQMSLDGLSLNYSFNNAAAPVRRTTQIFEMLENLGIYHNGWMAGTLPKRDAWDIFADPQTGVSIDTRQWALYNIQDDFTQSRNLAARYPEKLKEMQALFWAEAARNNILPLHDISQAREGRPSLEAGRKTFIYYPGVVGLPDFSSPYVTGRSYALTAKVIIPAEGAQGVLVTQGDRYGGYSFHLKDGKPVFHYNGLGPDRFTITAQEPLSAGPHELRAYFKSDENKPSSGGGVTLSVDGRPVASGRIPRTLPGRTALSLSIGRYAISPVSNDLSMEQSRFSGEVRSVLVELDPQK